MSDTNGGKYLDFRREAQVNYSLLTFCFRDFSLLWNETREPQLCRKKGKKAIATFVDFGDACELFICFDQIEKSNNLPIFRMILVWEKKEGLKASRNCGPTNCLSIWL